MAFRFIRPTADGTFQYVLSRQIEDPDTINLTDTPSNGETGIWNGNVTGSKQSIEFEKVTDEQLVLPTSEGLGTEFLLDGIGANPNTATDIMFETWMKIANDTYDAGYVMDWFDATVQRNENSSTVGYDGIYSNRIVNVDPENDSTSAFHVDFQFAKDTNFAYSCTSNNPIPLDTWTHVMTSYTSGSPESTGEMRIYINGVLDKQATLADLETWGAGNTYNLPPTPQPLPYRGIISFAGKLDEMRMWTSSGSAAAIGRLASVTSMGLIPEEMDTVVQDVYSPSGDYMVGWWRFETVSAFQIFASVPDAIIDSTQYEHNATAKFFEGATDFSDEQHGIFGGSSAFPLLKTGTPDNGGLLVVDNLDTTITLEEGIENIIPESQNTWTPFGAGAEVVVDEKQIWSGTSGVRIQTVQDGEGAYHEIDYNPHMFFDNNEYTASFRLLHTSGSVSALVTFGLGHPDNTVSTTAIMEKFTWNPVFIRNTVSADFTDPTITGFVKVTQLVDGVSPDNGQRYNLDGFYVKEGGYPASFVAPDDIRKGGQIYWEISD